MRLNQIVDLRPRARCCGTTRAAECVDRRSPVQGYVEEKWRCPDCRWFEYEPLGTLFPKMLRPALTEKEN